MSDTSREAVEALADRVSEVLAQEYEGNIPVGNITPDDMEAIPATLRALLDRAEAAEARVSDLQEQLVEANAPELEPLRQRGFAPGSYHCFCSDCGKPHVADKRAWRCLACAEASAALQEKPNE